MVAYIGLLCTVVSWLAGWWLLTKWRNKDFLSISRHATSSPLTLGVFAIVLVGFGALMYGWMYWCLAPLLGLGLPFRIVVVTAFVCQILTGLVPDIAGWRRVMHKIAAWTMAWLFLPLAWLIVTAANLSSVARIVCFLLALYMTMGVILALLRLIGKRFLFFQASYIVALQLLVLVAAYI